MVLLSFFLSFPGGVDRVECGTDGSGGTGRRERNPNGIPPGDWGSLPPKGEAHGYSLWDRLSQLVGVGRAGDAYPRYENRAAGCGSYIYVCIYNTR
ncbi:hypothetical protein GGS23DRAFT_556682 [Durotheca rogersii]|uniref:uncharacterized protein n=1 Tax=Durotheca rogersii TaxID=419775 RepID=UPI00221EA233|nr:uncharacterized protein GGS23DRAFT_556682 [Durotheca rogersii]KAI5866344.1 hypothetical protein GGS23DRAFT_556682 [Durotheca rogersii]